MDSHNAIESPDKRVSVHKMFETPTFRRVISVKGRRLPEKSSINDPFKSPTRSPRKLDLIDTRKDPSVLSPLVTPRGRQGRPSPARRTSEDLNNSAKKLAWNTRISARLADEDEADDYLNEQDLRIAEQIIEDSRIEESDVSDELDRAYGSDVEFEEDLTETPKKRSRGRPRKEIESRRIEEELKRTQPARKLQFLSDSEEEESEVDSINADLADEVVIEDESGLEEDILSDSDNEFVVKEQGNPTGKRRGRKRKTEVRSVEEPRQKRYNAIVQSIFQQDDDELFADRKTPSASPQKPATLQKQNEVDWSLIEDGVLPNIVETSGISNDNEEEADRKKFRDDRLKFQPFPVPKLNKDGSVPEEFIEKYLKDVGFDSEKTTHEVLDDRAFFYEGTNGYFDQKSNRDQHSVKTLAQLNIQLDYDEFSNNIELMKFFKTEQRNSLALLQKQLFHQYCFELSEGFNLVFYGVGSKIDIINEFAELYVFDWLEECYGEDVQPPKVLIISGYNPSLKLRDTAKDLVTGLLNDEEKEETGLRNPKFLSDCVPILTNYLNKKRGQTKRPIPPRLVLVVHNIDGETMRQQTEQNHLSQLATLPEVWLLASADNINTPLLWDLYKQKNYSFIWHDVTTYEPYIRELSFRDMLKIGKSKKLISSRGAKFVLNSLTSNSKKLYQSLLRLQMAQLEQVKGASKAEVATAKGNAKSSVKFRELYSKCVDEFITSNEINFRTMLREFVEHNMCNLQKDETGTEIVFVPYTHQEMTKILKEVFHK